MNVHQTSSANQGYYGALSGQHPGHRFSQPQGYGQGSSIGASSSLVSNSYVNLGNERSRAGYGHS